MGCCGIVLLSVVVTAWSVWSFTSRFRPHDIKPVALTQQEEQAFQQKVDQLKLGKSSSSSMRGKSSLAKSSSTPAFEPISFSSKEITALISGREFGNNTFKLMFDEGSIRVLANIPIPQELGQSLEGNMGPLDGIVSSLLSTEMVPLSARVRLNLNGGKVILELMEADMMGFPLSTMMGDTWSEWQRLDVMAAFGAENSTLETMVAGLGSLKFDEKGLHLGIQ
jgi:hypothetical protein